MSWLHASHVTACSVIHVEYFKGTYCLDMRTEAVCSSETPLTIQHTMQSYIIGNCIQPYYQRNYKITSAKICHSSGFTCLQKITHLCILELERYVYVYELWLCHWFSEMLIWGHINFTFVPTMPDFWFSLRTLRHENNRLPPSPYPHPLKWRVKEVHLSCF